MACPPLLIIIFTMLMISIHPYTVRKAALIGLALCCLSFVSAFAESNYITVKSTPYDRQNEPNSSDSNF